MEERIEDVFALYDWGVNRAYRTRGAWILETTKGLRLLKSFDGKTKHLEFEHEVKEYLYENGFPLTDRFEKNKEQQLISQDTTGKQYIVKEWISGEECNLKELEASIKERDQRDMNREIAPLKQAEDAVFLDTSDMNIEEVVNAIIRLVKERE